MDNGINTASLDFQMQQLINQIRNTSVENPQQVKQSDFMNLLNNSISKVSELQSDSKQMAVAFQNGDSSVSLTDVMMASQKSNISFQAMVQVRNKFISAYQEIMNMQI